MNGNDRRILAVAATGHAMVHTFELSIPVLLPVWMGVFDLSVARTGVIASLGYAAFGIGALPAGALVDRYGSKPLIVSALVGMGGAFLSLLFVESAVAFALALVLWGAAASVYHPAGLALISTGVTERGHGFAYHGIAGNIGTAVGPFVVVILLGRQGWPSAVVALATVAVTAGVVAAFADLNERPGSAADVGAEAGTPAANGGTRSLSGFGDVSKRLFAGAFALVFVAIMLEGVYYRGVLTFLPSIFESVLPAVSLAEGTSAGRYAYSALLLVGIVGQYLGGRLTNRIDPARGLAGVFAALAVVALAFEPLVSLGTAGVAVVAVLLGVLLFCEQPLMQATVAEVSPPEVRGLTYGYTYLGVFGVGALGATLTGTFLAVSTRATLFVAFAVIAATAAVVATHIYRRNPA